MPLENDNQPGGQLLDPQDIRYIFGNLPPIHEVHNKLKSDLIQLSQRWSENPSIGNILLKHVSCFS